MKALTLHIRLTHACNADCDYCSSYKKVPDDRMSVNEYARSIDMMIEKMTSLGTFPDHVSIQYLGGEILLIPVKDLEAMVQIAREKFREKGADVIDGVQSNLIGSERRLDHLRSLFGTRIGTSIDSYGTQRKLKGSDTEYKVFFTSSEAHLQADHARPTPAVFTIDAGTHQNAWPEYQLAKESRRHLTVKRVFSGGKAIDFLPASDYTKTLMPLLDDWFNDPCIIVEPFHTMLKRYLQQSHGQYLGQQLGACHFQSDCAERSLSLEPNGDLYVCQDLADKNVAKIGNALTGEWDQSLWEHLRARSNHLPESCQRCEFLPSCRGGCMVDAHEMGRTFHDKGDTCETWLSIFNYFKTRITTDNAPDIARTLRRLEHH